MHETKIAQDIIAQAKRRGNVKKAIIYCGALAHLPAHELQHVMEVMAPFAVEVKETPAKVSCSCGYEGEPKIEMHSHDLAIYFCPRCMRVPTVLEGTDIMLKEVVADDQPQTYSEDES